MLAPAGTLERLVLKTIWLDWMLYPPEEVGGLAVRGLGLAKRLYGAKFEKKKILT
jgi:hypothetical protein